MQGGDPRADALSSYLMLGAFADARAIGDSISDGSFQEILQQKRRDPASAVVSGACTTSCAPGRLSTPTGCRTSPNWFTMIPDGAGQYGWCVLRQPSPDNITARQALPTATQRGIPMYSYGVAR